MEAQAIYPVRAGGAFNQENASQGMADAFQVILRENEARDLATRSEIARTDVPRDRVEREAEREAIARRRFDAAQETPYDDRYGDRRDERPEAAGAQATERSARGDHTDESQPRSERPGQSAEPATAKPDTHGDDDTPIASGTPADDGLGDERAPKLASPVIAADPVLLGNPTVAAPPNTQVANAVAVQAPAVTNASITANPKDALSNAARPAVVPAPTTVAAPQVALYSGGTTPVLGKSATPATLAPVAAKAIQIASPAAATEAGITLNAAQVKRNQATGQKASAPAVSAEFLETVGNLGNEKRAPTAAVIQVDRTERKTATDAQSLVKSPAKAKQAGRANPVQLPPSSVSPGPRTSLTSDTAADTLKATASASNTSQASAAPTGFDPMQVAARAAGVQAGSAPVPDRPVTPHQLAVTIQRAVALGEDRIRIQLHPAELGQVDIRLKVGADGIVRAMVQVDRPETLDLLQRDARGLERALQDAGLKTDSGSLSFNLRDNGKDGLQDRDSNGDNSVAGREQADGDSSIATEAAEGPIHNGWSNRVLDIRV